MQRGILEAIYMSSLGKLVEVTISQLRFPNGFILARWKRTNDLQAMSIVFNRCSSTMTSLPVFSLWRRYCDILPFNTATTFTLQRLSIFYPPPPINDELCPECITFACSVLSRSFFPPCIATGTSYERYSFHWSVSIYELNLTQWCIWRCRNSKLWITIVSTNSKGLGHEVDELVLGYE